MVANYKIAAREDDYIIREDANLFDDRRQPAQRQAIVVLARDDGAAQFDDQAPREFQLAAVGECVLLLVAQLHMPLFDDLEKWANGKDTLKLSVNASGMAGNIREFDGLEISANLMDWR